MLHGHLMSSYSILAVACLQSASGYFLQMQMHKAHTDMAFIILSQWTISDSFHILCTVVCVMTAG